jgi:hypothetical protein
MVNELSNAFGGICVAFVVVLILLLAYSLFGGGKK